MLDDTAKGQNAQNGGGNQFAQLCTAGGEKTFRNVNELQEGEGLLEIYNNTDILFWLEVTNTEEK